MKKNFKVDKKEIKDVENYGLTMAKLAIQALFGLVGIGITVGMAKYTGGPLPMGYIGGGGLTTLAIVGIIKNYKKHKEFKELNKKEEEKIR